VLNNYEDPASYYFIRDWSPERILDYAAKVGHLKLTESLLKRKISPNIRSYTSQRTPLHEACISGFNKEVVGTLLKYGARRSAISKDGTPLQCVESCLRALEAMPGANEVTALKMRKLEAIRALLQEKTASIYSFAIPKLYDK
jgi:ankyrin repeat protein